MAEALLEIVIENLGSLVQDQLATYWGVDEQTEKLSSNLKAIRAVLRDAERKQITSYAVKDWLQKLTDAAYVLDDILDECSIHSTKMHSVDAHTSRLSRLHPKDILFRFHIGKRMKDITQRFHNIHEERLTFELRVDLTKKQAVDDDDDWRETSSVITEPILYGRDEDREKIVKFLLEDASNSDELTIYAIVGMGGLGKTTLAKEVFHDDGISKHFDLKIWICVSDDFKVKEILQSIIECTLGPNHNLDNLEARRKKVEEALQSKRYLLVLDDVWNENREKWNELKGMLECARGAKGAAILVTTRLQEVVSIMGTHFSHPLKALSEDDSWSLFKQHAFGPNRQEREELKVIGEEIVRKCVGSPLAIKTLGSCLRDENEVTQWKNVKESEIWDIREESNSTTGEENSIMRALKLSYSNLEPYMRRCFSLCAIYPKDFQIEKEELIHLWIANGFIKCEGNVEVEDVGNKVWKKLYSRSFFQEAEFDKFGMITRFKMHDLFHDLAQSIMGEECVVIMEKWLTSSSRVHYLNLKDYSLSVDASSVKLAFKKAESLRTLFYFRHMDLKLSNHCCLRALHTHISNFSSLKSLAHLRYLSLSGRFLGGQVSLYNSICELPKLQILKLCYCQQLHGLPKNLTQLQDLRHIVIDNCPSIVEMSPNMSKLRHLKTLSIFVVGSKPGYGLAELHSLKLGGTLRIKGLENVANEWDAKQANLMSKRELNHLYLSWSGRTNSKGSNVDVERVLEALEPPSTLKSFQINWYQGRHLSSWMRSPVALRDVVEVKLFNCDNCEELPPLGKLPHLKRLEVSGMMNVKFIDGETYDDVEEKAFPSLEKLTMTHLPNLERMLRQEGVEMLPRLSQLTIYGVSNLKFPRVPSLRILNIYHCKFTSLPDWLGDMTSLEELSIWFCKELRSLPSSIQRLTNLSYLSISDCPHLKKRCNRETGEDWQYIKHIPKIVCTR